jgi:glycosyltransferase involved in cell wall biosynthesis
MNVLLWHVHGSWTTAFVQGGHRYLVPVDAERSPYGRGRARTWRWPDSVVEVDLARARPSDFDVAILQRPEELDLVVERLGVRPGLELPAVYLEHNAPQGAINEMRHPVAGRPELTLVHVTHFNRLYWDGGATPTRVIEHGIVDPGLRYRGILARGAAVVNEPMRRARVTGTDLLDRFRKLAPIDLFGIASEALGGVDHPQETLHEQLAERRFYLHPYRWTSLGLALLEAMQLGMPVVALAATEVPSAVPPEAGFVSNRIDELEDGMRALLRDPELARAMGRAARVAALARYGLARFLADWDALLEEVAA